MKDDRIIALIQVMSVMMPIRRFEVKFYPSSPKYLTDPHFDLFKSGPSPKFGIPGCTTLYGSARWGQ
jgi:hypothetical protein